MYHMYDDFTIVPRVHVYVYEGTTVPPSTINHTTILDSFVISHPPFYCSVLWSDSVQPNLKKERTTLLCHLRSTCLLSEEPATFIKLVAAAS